MNTKNVIQNTLDRTGLNKIQPSQSIVDKALSFDVKDLDIKEQNRKKECLLWGPLLN
jgi:hypothetical protein